MTELEVSFLDGERYYYPEPCPFCGSKRVEFSDTGFEMPVSVMCVDCNCFGPQANYYQDDPYQVATDKWNKRIGGL